MRPRPVVVVVIVVAVAVVAGVAVWFVAGSEDDAPAVEGNRRSDDEAARLSALVREAGLEDPAKVELPADDDASAGWFESDGALLVAFVEETKVLWVDPDVDCDSLGGTLDGLGEPEEVAGVSASVPDEVSRELFVDLYASTVRAMDACQDGRELGEFAWQWALADRRLDELGVQR